MKIPEQGVKEYRQLVRKKRGVDISFEEAHQQFSDLLLLFKTVYRPMEKEKARKT